MATISLNQFARKMADSVKKLETDKKLLPKIIANSMVNKFQDNFKEQTWNGSKWEEVKRRIPGTNEYKYPKTKGLSRRVKAILNKTGALRRSISVKSADWEKIVIWANPKEAPYAIYHNEGTLKIPQRKFLGYNRNVNNLVIRLFKKELDSLL